MCTDVTADVAATNSTNTPLLLPSEALALNATRLLQSSRSVQAVRYAGGLLPKFSLGHGLLIIFICLLKFGAMHINKIAARLRGIVRSSARRRTGHRTKRRVR